MYRRLAPIMLIGTLALGSTALWEAPALAFDDDARAHRQDRQAHRAEMESRILNKVQELSPERHTQMLEIREKYPMLYRKMVLKSARMLKHADEDPQAVDRFFSVMDLTQELGGYLEDWDSLSASQQKKRRADIERVASDAFDLKQEIRTAKLQQMEERIEKMRAEIEERSVNKDEIVDEFVNKAIQRTEEGPKRGGL